MTSRARAPYRIRPAEPRDDDAVVAIVREGMREFGLGDGVAAGDLDPAPSRAYPGGRARLFVVELDGTVQGCGAFGPLDSRTAGHAAGEIRRMYFRAPLRGRGAGRELLRLLLRAMARAGYTRCYLETSSRMEAARSLYRSMGFHEVPALPGRPHGRCDRAFARDLGPPH